MSTTYKTGDEPNCPHCGKPLNEGPIDNFVVPNRSLNIPEENDCGWCDRLFDVTKTAADTFVITKKLGSR